MASSATLPSIISFACSTSPPAPAFIMTVVPVAPLAGAQPAAFTVMPAMATAPSTMVSALMGSATRIELTEIAAAAAAPAPTYLIATAGDVVPFAAAPIVDHRPMLRGQDFVAMVRIVQRGESFRIIWRLRVNPLGDTMGVMGHLCHRPSGSGRVLAITL